MGLLHIAIGLLASMCLASAQVYSYCDLHKPASLENPGIMLDTPHNMQRFAYPRQAIEQALARDSAARDFVRSQGLAASAANRSASGSAPQRNANRVAPTTKKYDAPMMEQTMCSQKESRVIGSFDENGAFCFIVDQQEVPYFECSEAECDVNNPFPFFQKYYCAPSSFVFNTAMVWCDNGGPMKFQTFEIPVQCACKKYNCNLDGMMV